jgi:MFS family permease
MGQGVIWYTGQFYALFFIQTTQQVDYLSTYTIIGIALLLGTPFFVFFGWLSDRIGRLYIILAGCLIGALSYFTLFGLLAQAVNPGLYEWQQKAQIHVTADPANCHFNLFPQWPGVTIGDCDSGKNLLASRGVSFTSDSGPAGSKATLKIGDTTVEGFNAAAWTKALVANGYPNFKATDATVALTAEQLAAYTAADTPAKKLAVVSDARKAADPKAGTLAAATTIVGEPAPTATGADVPITVLAAVPADVSRINWVGAVAIVWIMVIFVTMVYGPIAAFLVELFPTRIRYTSMSLPYHIGNGWFGGLLPLVATAMVAAAGNIYFGLWFPIVIALLTVVIGAIFLRNTKDANLEAN